MSRNCCSHAPNTRLNDQQSASLLGKASPPLTSVVLRCKNDTADVDRNVSKWHRDACFRCAKSRAKICLIFIRGMAEREGFEPPIGLHLCRISSAVLSTTQPPLRVAGKARLGPFRVVRGGNNMGTAPGQARKSLKPEGSERVSWVLAAWRLHRVGLFLKSAQRCPYGGTGRRVRLKIGFRKECWFDSG